MKQPFRHDKGIAVDTRRFLSFRFNGRQYSGHPGDTLASALLANGIHMVARSFKYHRPRGILAAGVEDPGALVQLGNGGRATPNVKATELALFDGLRASSVNVFPSLVVDTGAVIGCFSRLLPAGFYYKTFFASRRLWQHVFEPLIRRAAGWGRAADTPDPDSYEHIHIHCDVLVVGAGPAGIMAARTAASGGTRVILAEQDTLPGGQLLQRSLEVDGLAGHEWAQSCLQELAAVEDFQFLPRTTVFGRYDNNYFTALEQLNEAPDGAPGQLRQRVWHIHAARGILATGAHERPLVFANNDRPGIMLMGAVQAYCNRWGVLAGRRLVLFTNNDRAYEGVLDAIDADMQVEAVIDCRTEIVGELPRAVRARGIDILAGHGVVDTRGGFRVSSVMVAPLFPENQEGPQQSRTIQCDVLAVSGGYSPTVHLYSHTGGKLQYDEKQGCFKPLGEPINCYLAGACKGSFGLQQSIREGHDSAVSALQSLGLVAGELQLPVVAEISAGPPRPLWLVPGMKKSTADYRKHFVDLQNDTSAADIHLSVREGFESVEHMKRYTLTGFGTDQGKTSNINALAILATTLGRSIEETGTTTFRPPYTPVSFAAMAGRDRGELFEPVRITAMHDRHVEAGAEFENVGQWQRPWYYPRPGESMQDTVRRECQAVRNGVAMFDASTLGKIDIQGPDAASLLNRIYTNRWDNLDVGRVRYGLMCGEDGMVMDDGTTARLDENHFHMTTTTSGAAAVLDHMEEYLQTEWPDMRVWLTSVTEQWAVLALAGPKANQVLTKVAPDLALSSTAFPFMSWQTASVAGLPARVFRVSFSGELQYEINVPWRYGTALWDAVADAGEEFGITPYGTEAMHVLRAEKGFIIVGQDTDGQQTPADLGLDWLLSNDKDFIGRRSLSRSDSQRKDRQQLVGLLGPADGSVIEEGLQLVAPGTAQHPPPVPIHGFVTSSYWSDTLGRNIALALVKGGRERTGEQLEAVYRGKGVPVTLCDPRFYDREGSRQDGS